MTATASTTKPATATPNGATAEAPRKRGPRTPKGPQRAVDVLPGMMKTLNAMAEDERKKLLGAIGSFFG